MVSRAITPAAISPPSAIENDLRVNPPSISWELGQRQSIEMPEKLLETRFVRMVQRLPRTVARLYVVFCHSYKNDGKGKPCVRR